MRFFWIVFMFVQTVSAAFAQDLARVALVIGNGGYQHVTNLPNPANDASDLSRELNALGFDVETVIDADFATLRRSLHGFQRKAQDADVALVYFAGHGVEIDNRNHMIPVDARLERDIDVAFEAIPLEQIMLAASGARHLSLVILDACRDNPFVANMDVSSGTRSIGRGLAIMEPSSSKNTLLAYAAKAGTVAFDGNNRNSPYARALIDTIKEPGLEISLMFRTIRDQVLEETNGRQEPFLYGSLSANQIFLNPPVAEQSPVTETEPQPTISEPPGQLEVAFWKSISDSTDPLDFQAYLQVFPEGVFVPLAKNRLASLAAPKIEHDTSEDVLAALATTEPLAPVEEPVREPLPLAEPKLAPSEEAQTDTRPSNDPLTRAEIRELQERLSILGFRLGLADGIAGPRTTGAIKTYEEQKGGDPIGTATWGVLKLLQDEVSNTELVSWRAARQVPVPKPAPVTPKPAVTAAQPSPKEPAKVVSPAPAQTQASARSSSQWCQQRYELVCYHECSSATGFFGSFSCDRCTTIHNICGKP